MGPQPTLNWSTLIRPRKVADERDADRRGQFGCEPLDRGQGDALGRALRQALLDAVPGTAVVGVRARLRGDAPAPAAWRHLDRLLFDVETNRAVSAHDALWTAVRALTAHSRAA